MIISQNKLHQATQSDWHFCAICNEVSECGLWMCQLRLDAP